ncbi:MAG TPA: HAD family phosphatase [Syntrophales bacterium]|nr:HAD family phosphatase [Syntrophales bacterium]
MIKAVLFDNDGVLIDSESVFFTLTREALATAGAELHPSYLARQYLGNGLKSMEVAESLGLVRSIAAGVIEARNRRFMARLQEGFIPLAGVAETLSVLRPLVRMALVTGSPRDKLLLAHQETDILALFDCIITSDDCSQSKPHPAPYRAAMNQLGIMPGECLAVEDSPRGLNAAHAAGIRCLLIPTPLTDMDMCRHADWIEPDITGVLRIVQEENK